MLLENFNTAYEKVKTEKQKNIFAKSAMEDEFNFTIVEGRDVNIVEKENYTYYNILIERTVNDSLYFENLVLKISANEDIDAFIAKYNKNNLNATIFQEGDIELTAIINKVSSICFSVCEMLCNDLGGGEYSTPHSPDSGCSGGNISLDCRPICFSSGGGGGGYDGGPAGPSGPGNTSPSGGGGSGGGTPPPTIPTEPQNQNGGGNNPPEVVVYPVLEMDDDLADDPCVKMKFLKNDTGFKSKLSRLKTRATPPNYFETCMVLRDNDTLSTANNYDYAETQGNPKLNSQNFSASYSFTPGVSKGIIHNHYSGLLSIFTIQDLIGMYNIVKTAGVNSEELVFGLLTRAGTVYVITISDRQKFINFGNKNLVKYDDYVYLESEVNKNYKVRTDRTNDENEQGFKEMLKDYNVGLNLFKGDTTTFDSWTKIEKNKTDINCND